MRRFFLIVISTLFLHTISSVCTAQVTCEIDDTLLGIRWEDSQLVSFDPNTGTITEVHGQLNSNESFRGLTYDSNYNMLYALAQVSHNLYSIDPITMAIQHIGNLDIPCGGFDIGGLTYDPSLDVFYTTLSDARGDSTELLTVDVSNAEVSSLGQITDEDFFNPSYNEDDGQIYGFALKGDGSVESPYKSSVVTINPEDLSITTLFETPYRHLSGLVKMPDENSFYTRVNADTHFYAKINLDTEEILQLANSDSVGVTSAAMVFKTLQVGSGSLLPTEEYPVSFDIVAHVKEIRDPDNLLGGDVEVGDEFSGQMVYDINGIFLHTLMQSPYGISLEIGGHTFAQDGLTAKVKNNHYDCESDSIADRISFSFENQDEGWEVIGLSLTDSSSAALSNHTYLPKSYDLTAWDEIFFYIYKKVVSPSGKSSSFWIEGVIDKIISDIDSDGDGTPDHTDNCPNDPEKVDAGICGCGIADTDSNGDGIPDCIGYFPDDQH